MPISFPFGAVGHRPLGNFFVQGFRGSPLSQSGPHPFPFWEMVASKGMCLATCDWSLVLMQGCVSIPVPIRRHVPIFGCTSPKKASLMTPFPLQGPLSVRCEVLFLLLFRCSSWPQTALPPGRKQCLSRCTPFVSLSRRNRAMNVSRDGGHLATSAQLARH